jgi:hypothetical protein
VNQEQCELTTAPAPQDKRVQKPLFIPLCSKWFRQFESGVKTKEYRVYGPHWNERTCAVGREAVLAHGYGHPRLNRRIVGFTILPFDKGPKEAREIYPDAISFAEIELSEDAEI